MRYDLTAIISSWPVHDYDTHTSRGSHWPTSTPAGIMVHHTAPPVPYPLPNLAGAQKGRIKANLNIKPDGKAWAIAGGACNYASGPGSSLVLAEVRNDQAPPDTALARGLIDDMTGNRYFINIEVDHPGDTSPLPAVARQALIALCADLCTHHGWTANRVISHQEWTRRKSDPNWDGTVNPMPAIRADTHALMTGEADMWKYLNIDESLVRHASEQGWYKLPDGRPDRSQKTLNYWLANLTKLQEAVAPGGFEVDWLAWRRAVTNGIARGGKDGADGVDGTDGVSEAKVREIIAATRLSP